MHLLESMARKYHGIYAIDGVLLGCTELSLLYDAYQLTSTFNNIINIIDTLDILAQSLLQHALVENATLNQTIQKSYANSRSLT
jgi:aspartate/glutamate racemase